MRASVPTSQIHFGYTGAGLLQGMHTMNSWNKSKPRNAHRSRSTFTRAGEIAERILPQVQQIDSRGREVADFAFGNVWSRIWRNTRQDGTHYFRISLNRLEARNGETLVRNNFTPSDLNDVIRAVRRCHIWLRENHK